jgi:hypothetical protein
MTVSQLKTEAAALSVQNKELAAGFSHYREQCDKMEARYKNASEILKEQDNILKQLNEKLEAAPGTWKIGFISSL